MSRQPAVRRFNVRSSYGCDALDYRVLLYRSREYVLTSSEPFPPLLISVDLRVRLHRFAQSKSCKNLCYISGSACTHLVLKTEGDRSFSVVSVDD